MSNPNAGEEDYDPDFEDEYDPDDEFLDFVCGMMPDGQCRLAGTEDCDWDCPRWK